MSTKDDLAAAVADIRSALATIDQEEAPYRSFIPQNVNTVVEALKAQLADAVDRIEAVSSALP